MEILSLSAVELLSAYRNRQLSPVEVVSACLARIGTLDPALNAICFTDEPTARKAAQESEARWRKGDPRGLLDGVPVTVKDLFQTKGWPTLCGSRTVSPDGPWLTDAPAVARLREHGAVLIAKTTTSEFGHKGVGDSPLTGITRNPWYPTRTPGGSSAGAGVAAAAGYAPLNLGSDGGGSIRIPASFCGVFGFKPGFGRVPTIPGTGGSLVADGPITRTVGDAALMLNVIAEPDRRDPYAFFAGKDDSLTRFEDGMQNWRIGFAPTINGAFVESEVATHVRRAAASFSALGAEIEEIQIDLPRSVDAYFVINSVAMAAHLRSVPAEKRVLMDAGLQSLICDGESTPSTEYARELQITRAGFSETMAVLHERYRVLILPTMPRVAFDVALDYPGEQDGSWRADWTPFTFPFNLTGQPACSIPCAFSQDGLPIGMQIVGPVRGEADVLRAARAFETLNPIGRWSGTLNAAVLRSRDENRQVVGSPAPDGSRELSSRTSQEREPR